MAEAYVWPELKGRSQVPEEAPEIVRQRAAEEGYATGLARGLEEGRSTAEQETAAMREQLAAAVGRLDGLIDELTRRDLSTIAGVCLALCRNVLGWELRTTPEAFELMLKDALTQLDVKSADVDVHLHPDDYAWVKSLYRGDVALHADPLVPRGGFSVRARERAADFDPHSLLDQLFDDVRRELLG